MKIGIQCLAYNCAESFPELIAPWLKMKYLAYDIDIWVASGQFKEYAELGYEDKNESTLKLLTEYKNKGKINYVWTPDPNNLLKDHETRNQCIPYFKEKDIDVMIQLDADEFYTDEEAFNLIKFIEENPGYSIYNAIYKNIVGDGEEVDWKRFVASWIKKHGGIKNYYFDMHWSYNDCEYRQSPDIDIPKSLVNPTHYTWTNNNNTTGPSHIKEKIEYQKRIYSSGCDYEWDESSKKVVKKGEVETKVNLVFSTARRYELFNQTLKSLIKHNPSLNEKVNRVYVVDDRSSGRDLNQMREDLSNNFPNKVTLITFNNSEKYGWLDKLNFIKNLKEEADYFLFWEDDWESVSSINLSKHLQYMNDNPDVDLITFSGHWDIQPNMEGNSIDDGYFKCPFPKWFRQVFRIENGMRYWSDVRMNNFSLNPSLFRIDAFNQDFIKEDNHEFDYADKSNLKQIYTKEPSVIHIGHEESILKSNNNL